MNSQPWVLIDASYLFYRALYSIKNLELDDIPTGTLIGFFTQLKNICTSPQVQSNKVCIFFDSRKCFRRIAYPEYKQKRVTQRDEDMTQKIYSMRDQMKIIRKFLPKMGVAVYRQTGLESDDLLAEAAAQLKGGRGKKKGVIISSDGDLFQCITDSCHWHDAQRRTYYDPWRFQTAKGIHPSKWGEMKALAGCVSDNVAGIKGVGEKTAIKYLLGFLPNHVKAFKAIESDEGKAIRERNRALVILPHSKTKPVELKEPEFKPKRFFKFCEKHRLVQFLEPGQRKAWIRFFRGNRKKLRKRGEKR